METKSKDKKNSTKEYLFKILIIGEISSGKTSFIKRYVHNFFSSHYRATIGLDFALKVIKWNENTVIRLQLWDIAGQERFGNMTRVYYKEAVGAFIIFDVQRKQTLDAVYKWKSDLDSKVTFPDGSNIPCVLLANKCDLEKDEFSPNPTFLNNFCEKHSINGWFYTSAKDNINIEESARFLITQILRKQKAFEDTYEQTQALSLNLFNDQKDLKKKCYC